ncbi:MAG: phosphatase PAP2 family protein [Planctomycetota bacterium]|nr:phosphatase PAP2 family protein [Planctomycetota bacterium]
MKCPIRILVFGTIAFVAGFVLLTFLDEPIYHAIDPTLASRERLDTTWWYLILRHSGSLWTWFILGIGLSVFDRIRHAQQRPDPTKAAGPSLRGVHLAISAGAAGLAAELLKLVIGRERPATIETLESGVQALVYQGYHFRGLFSGFADGSNLGLPSSHAATAAGGAFALALVWPRLWLPALGISVGCGVSRLLTGAHFATDVYAGIVLGWLAALWLRDGLISAPVRRKRLGRTQGDSSA